MLALLQHLGDKLRPIAEEVGVDSRSMTEDSVIEAIEAGERTLCEMQARVRLSDITTQGAASMQALGDAVQQRIGRPFNQRVDLPSMTEDSDGDGNIKENSPFDEDELTRDKVKRGAQQMQEKKK